MQKSINNIVFTNEICTAGFSRLETAKEHKHGMIQIFLFLDNQGLLVVNGKQVMGNCICIPPNTTHSYAGNGSFCLTILLDPLTRLAQFILNRETPIQINDSNQLHQSMRTLLRMQTTDSFQRFLYEFYEQIDYQESNEPLYDERVIQTIGLVREKVKENITVHEISKLVGLSDSRISHLFKQEAGFTIKNYILMMKWKAAYLLMLENKNVTISAMDGGFASSSHFTDTNTKMTGIVAKQMTKYSTIIKE